MKQDLVNTFNTNQVAKSKLQVYAFPLYIEQSLPSTSPLNLRFSVLLIQIYKEIYTDYIFIIITWINFRIKQLLVVN